MAYQVRTGSAGSSSSLPSADRSSSSINAAGASAAFRSTRNDLASTLRAAGGGMAVESRSNPNTKPIPTSATSSYSSSSSPLPAIPSASARPTTVSFPSPPSSSYGARPTSKGSAFPSVDKFAAGSEESKEQAGSIGAATKDKDWNLWHGAAEAQWILSVLDDISNKLTLASFLHPDILKDKICESIDPEMLLTLKEHFQVENQYHEFLDSDLWKLNATEAKNQELFHELDMCLADSTRTVTRLLKQNVALVRRMRELNNKRNPATLDFINTFARLRMLMHHKLRMTAEEERHMKEQLQELKLLEEEDTQKFIELTERLAVERNEHEQALSAKDRKIQRLTQQIEQLQSRTSAERHLFEEKMREENDSAEKAFKTAEKDLLKQLETLQAQLETDGNENFRAELLYHRKKNLRALDVTNLIEKYDVDMTLKHESVVDMEAVYVKEKKELEALTGYFAVRDAEDKRVADEHQRIREERDAELQVERRNQQAALLVQQLYKGWYAKNGPKEPKPKKPKKKKDPFAGLRSRPKTSRPEAAASPTAASAAAAGAAGSDASPAASGPEDSEGEAKEVPAE